jgi:uncharacterized heparinase superfamily protein
VPSYTLGGTFPPTIDFLHHDCWNSRTEICKGNFCFLNHAEQLGWPIDWRAGTLPLLWQYNLHYFNYLFLLDPPQQESICLQWLQANPFGKGVAWHPYPTSLRIVNWCKAQFSNQALLQSLYTQASYLYRHREAHHPGNHLLENAKALIFAGSFFAGQGEARNWLETGLRMYRKETPKQILEDGGYFERSPMYHALVLEGYLDIINLLPESVDKNMFTDAAKAMSDFLLSVTHPQGEIALFNDSTREIAPKTKDLLAYAEKLLGSKAEKKAAFSQTGYFIHQSADLYLIIDGGPISPDFLPAHAHADIFSYELSLQGKPLVVDAGVFDYQAGAMRDYVRSTRAHNTVCVDGVSQAECWGSFRVARRYPPSDVSFRKTGNRSQFQGRFAGYAKLIGDQIIHKRAVTCDEASREILVEDFLEGRGEHAIESCIHLHPEARVEVEGSGVVAKIDEVQGVIEILAGDWTVEDSWYCPEFGLRQQNKVIVIGGRMNLPARIAYRILY